MAFINLVVHEFALGDVEDPVLYAAQPLWEWQNTDAGKWVMENAVETPSWGQVADANTYSYKFRIIAKLTEENATFFKLKFK